MGLCQIGFENMKKEKEVFYISYINVKNISWS